MRPALSGTATSAMTWPGASATPSSSFTFNDLGEETWQYDRSVRTWVYSSNNPDGAIAERHLETINVLYTDGHVKAVSLASIAAGKTIKVRYSNNTVQDRYVYTAWSIEDD